MYYALESITPKYNTVLGAAGKFDTAVEIAETRAKEKLDWTLKEEDERFHARSSQGRKFIIGKTRE